MHMQNIVENIRRRISLPYLKQALGISPAIRLGPGHKPLMISIEPTSLCNLNCPFCLVGQQNSLESTAHDLLPRGLGHMEWDTFEKILRDAVDFGIKKMQLHFQGEPLLYARFPEMIERAKHFGLYTQVFTNGLPLTKRKVDQMSMDPVVLLVL